MSRIRRFGNVIIAVLLIGLLVTGIPFDRLMLTVRAVSYGTAIDGACGNDTATFQVRLKGDTAFYSDANLTASVGVITTQGKALQKFIACDSSLSSTKSILIDLAGQGFYISRNAGTLAPRAAADNQ